MLVCHCAAVKDGQIREEIACGAANLTAVGEACGAGTFCGGCIPAIQSLLACHGHGANVAPTTADPHDPCRYRFLTCVSQP